MLPLHVAVTIAAKDEVDKGIKHFSDCMLTIFSPSCGDPENVPAEQALHVDEPGKFRRAKFKCRSSE